MNDTHLEVLSAFCDGEAVDPAALAHALDDPDGRTLLVDFVRLREAVRRPGDPLPASLGSLRRRAGWTAGWFPSARVPLPVAAALVALALLASLAWPGARDAGGPPLPPTPTQTLRFVPGVDWQMP